MKSTDRFPVAGIAFDNAELTHDLLAVAGAVLLAIAMVAPFAVYFLG